jgi:hypothetical protein
VGGLELEGVNVSGEWSGRRSAGARRQNDNDNHNHN